nr:hypothetical protein [Kibdelosporangium sp. MJ126-NF4]CTQ96924.1 hypothetical protein [Kibdelosporangium sp. MJ126-NF4]
MDDRSAHRQAEPRRELAGSRPAVKQPVGLERAGPTDSSPGSERRRPTSSAL